jgi:hypothetical protein
MPHRPLPARGLTALALSALALGCALPAQAGESYGAIGLPGITLGYAQTVNATLGLRADVSSTGSFSKDGTESGIRYMGKAKYNRAGLFADYFPFGGRFRLTGGLTYADASVVLKSQFDGATSVTLNGQTVTPAASDYLNARVSFPKVMPYVGIGWGHQEREAGFGFVGDIGASIGRAKLKTDTNLVGQTYGSVTITQADVDAKTQELRDSVGKVRLLPQLNLGLSYRY